MEGLLQHIGSRIRLYRKAAGLRVGDLAERIYKSKSTMSKYENGEVAIDVSTLFDIAEALHIPVSKLIDVQNDYRHRHAQSLISPRGFFNSPGLYHMYHIDGEAGRIIHSAIEVQFPATPEESYSAVFYNDIEDDSNLHSCLYYYYGEISFSDLYVNFHFTNQSNEVEKCFLVVVNTLKNSNQTHGIVTGISNTFLVPVSYRALFSRTAIQDEAELQRILLFSKDELAKMKRRNLFLLSNFPAYSSSSQKVR